ncbi:MAG TPA: O-antigen ligase family protein [Acidimicrobiia bacterium]|jgi:O-antigen ligase
MTGGSLLPVGLVMTAAIWAVTLIIAKTAKSPVLRNGAKKGYWVLFAATTVVLLGTHSFAEGDDTAEELLTNPLGNGNARIARGALVAITLALIAPPLIRLLRNRQRKLPWPAMGMLTAYVAIAAVSTIYSAAPVVTIAKVVELSAGLAVVWVFALRPDNRIELRQVLRFVILLEAALVVGAIIGFFVAPDYFYRIQPWKPGWLFLPSMTSPFAHANSLSARGAMVATYALAMILKSPPMRERILWAALALVQTYGVILASGRQGILILLAGVAILMFVHKPRLFAAALLPAAVATVVVFREQLLTIFARNQLEALGKLSGRLTYWQAAVDVWSREPMTGYGFGAAGRFVAFETINVTTRSMLHSGYMELLSGLGILGVLPFVYVIYRACLWSYRKLRSRQETELAILIVPLLIHTAVANGVAAWLTADFFMFAIIAALSDIELRQNRLHAYSPPPLELVRVSAAN